MQSAIEVLCRMRGMGKVVAEAFASQCQPEELAAIETAETGAELQQTLDAIADRLNQQPEE